MPSLEALSLPGFDPATGMLMLPWWAAAAVVGVPRRRHRGRHGAPAATVVSGLAAVAGSALVVALTGVWLTRSVEHERADDRRALSARAQELTVLAPRRRGLRSRALMRLPARAVEFACEKALFESPQTVSAAASYVASRVALLSDGIDYSLRANTSYEAVLPGVRRALEADRYGFVAHVLTVSYGCSPDIAKRWCCSAIPRASPPT